MKIIGLNKLRGQLEKRLGRARIDGRAVVVVGFTQNYAVYVHEDLSANHPRGGQAKFLEQPARTLSDDGTLGSIITDAEKAGKGIEAGLKLAGLRLQREAQELVPVDTSALKASAFTCVERDMPAVAAEAYAKSEDVRLEKLGKRATRRAKVKARNEAKRSKQIRSAWSKKFRSKSR